MSITININIPDLMQLLIYLFIGFVVAVVIGVLARIKSPLVVLFFMLVSAIGGWLVASFIQLQIKPSVVFDNVRVIEASIGALIIGLGSALFFTRRKLIIK